MPRVLERVVSKFRKPSEDQRIQNTKPQHAYRPERSQSEREFKIDFGPKDHAIAVMGVTGTGKSTFISLLVDNKIGIGHNLSSCTSQVGAFSFDNGDGSRVHLIDTPGFDDTFKSDTDVLREIAGFLGVAYKNNIKLSGIIYLHRIIDPRLAGSALKNLTMFKKLCGDQSLGSVILVTSWWGKVDPATGAAREKELLDTYTFWGAMVKKGSKAFRHDGSVESAVEIVQYLVSKDRKVTLDIQDQMINRGQTLDQTTAGRAVQDEISRLKEHFAKEIKQAQQERMRAIKEKDMEAARGLKGIEDSFNAKLQQMQTDSTRLHETMENLRKEREQSMKEENLRFQEKMAKEMAENARQVREKEFEIEKLKIGSKHELEKQALQNDKERLLLENKRYEREIQKMNEGSCILM